MRITNVTVSGIEESILASGFPMRTEHDGGGFEEDRAALARYVALAGRDDCRERYLAEGFSEDRYEWCLKQFRRVRGLGKCSGGESHDCYLCGIKVDFNMTCPRLLMPEVQRYHFMDIISSFSTMHCLRRNVKRILADESLAYEYFCPYTDIRVIRTFLLVAGELLESLPEDDTQWNSGADELIARLKAILPEGYLQTCRITTNYRQLKTWIQQRSDHRLQEWRDICKWIHTLPLFDRLTGSGAASEV